MNYSLNERVNEDYLQRLIDDIQFDYNMLLNSDKNMKSNKEKQIVTDRKSEKHTKMLGDLMNRALALKTLLGTLPKKKNAF